MSILYILGNGFDRHHGLKTCYSDFHTFIKNHHAELENDFGEYFNIKVDDNYFWYQFEEDLASFDWQTLYQRYDHTDILSDSFKPSETFGLEDELLQAGENLSETIRNSFSDWINFLDYPEHISRGVMLESLEENSRFITFNYTDTLERYYDVPRSSILYIHNKADGLGGELIFGHGTEKETKPKSDELDEDGNSNRTMFTDAEDAARGIFYEFKKDTESVINEHQLFFADLLDTTTIAIMGHSYGRVDWAYFKYLRNLLPKACWQMSYHGERDIINAKTMCIENLNLDWSEVQLFKMCDL